MSHKILGENNRAMLTKKSDVHLSKKEVRGTKEQSWDLITYIRRT